MSEQHKLEMVIIFRDNIKFNEDLIAMCDKIITVDKQDDYYHNMKLEAQKNIYETKKRMVEYL